MRSPCNLVPHATSWTDLQQSSNTLSIPPCKNKLNWRCDTTDNCQGIDKSQQPSTSILTVLRGSRHLHVQQHYNTAFRHVSSADQVPIGIAGLFLIFGVCQQLAVQSFINWNRTFYARFPTVAEAIFSSLFMYYVAPLQGFCPLAPKVLSAYVGITVVLHWEMLTIPLWTGLIINLSQMV